MISALFCFAIIALFATSLSCEPSLVVAGSHHATIFAGFIYYNVLFRWLYLYLVALHGTQVLPMPVLGFLKIFKDCLDHFGAFNNISH